MKIKQKSQIRKDEKKKNFIVGLSAFASSNNATYSVISKEAVNTVAPTTGLLLLAQINLNSAQAWCLASLWQSSPNTTPGASFLGSGGDAYGAIAIELKFNAQNAFIGKYY